VRLIANLQGRGHFADLVARLAIRRRLARRVRNLERTGEQSTSSPFPSGVPASSLARAFGTPPEQLPLTSLRSVLGPSLVDSCCAWPRWAKDLAVAEDEMMTMLSDRAEIEDGLRVLDISPGHGGLARCLRTRWGNAPVTVLATTEEHRQRLLHALPAATSEGIAIHLGTLRDLEPDVRFDRILAIESLPEDADLAGTLQNMADHLVPGGRALIQFACHRKVSYRFRTGDEHELWKLLLEPASLIPATDLLPRIQSPLTLLHHWELSGEHYQRTASAWLVRLDSNRTQIVEELRAVAGTINAKAIYRQWRLSLLATEELFGFHDGQEWWVSQYLLGAPGTAV